MEVFISASKVSSRDRIGLDESLTLNPATPFHFSKQTSKTFNDSLPRKNEEWESKEMLQTVFYFHTLVMPNNHEYCDYNEVESSIKMFYKDFILGAICCIIHRNFGLQFSLSWWKFTETLGQVFWAGPESIEDVAVGWSVLLLLLLWCCWVPAAGLLRTSCCTWSQGWRSCWEETLTTSPWRLLLEILGTWPLGTVLTVGQADRRGWCWVLPELGWWGDRPASGRRATRSRRRGGEDWWRTTSSGAGWRMGPWWVVWGSRTVGMGNWLAVEVWVSFLVCTCILGDHSCV